MHAPAHLRALWQGVQNSGPGNGGEDRGTPRHAAQVRQHTAAGTNADAALLQRGSDPEGTGGGVRGAGPEVSGAAGGVPLQQRDAAGSGQKWRNLVKYVCCNLDGAVRDCGQFLTRFVVFASVRVIL